MADETKLSTADLFEPGGRLKDMAFDDEYLKLLPGALARKEWDTYITDFMPFEDMLMQQTHYENPAMVGKAIEGARPTVSSAIELGKGAQGRRLQALGQYVSPEAQARIDKGWARQESKAHVDAANTIRMNIAERSRNIAFGGGGAIATGG